MCLQGSLPGSLSRSAPVCPTSNGTSADSRHSAFQMGDWTKADMLFDLLAGLGSCFCFYLFLTGVCVRTTSSASKKDRQPAFPGLCLLHVRVYYLYYKSSINKSRKKVVMTAILKLA